MRILSRRSAPLAAAAFATAFSLLAAPAHADGVVGGDALGTHATIAAAGAPALPHNVTAHAWLVADMDTGEVLAAHDAHGRYAPASTLKVLTALTLIPRLDPAQKVGATFDDLNVDGSRVGLVEHVGYPVSELFEAMLVTSANDAANTLATTAGGLATTARLMNETARHLHADDTNAVNPSGLDDPAQRSSAYDLALIGRAAMQLPEFRAYVATKRSSISGPGHRIAIASHDKLLWNYDGAIGIKNGYTARAGATFIGAATRGGHTLIVTAMKATPRVWPEIASLMDWGFAARARGVQPVGQLVEPGAPPAPQAARIRPAAAARPAAQQKSSLPLAVVGLGTMTMVLTVVRRRRRSRNPLRLDLPL